MERISADSELMLENLMINNNDVIYFKDRDSKFIKVNDAFLRKHGGTQGFFIGKTDFDLYGEEHAAKAFRDEQRIVETGIPLSNIEERLVWHDGSVTWASSSKMPLRDDQGQIIGTFGMSRDITDQKTAQLNARRDSEQIRRIKEDMEQDVGMAGELLRSFMAQSYPVFSAEGDDSCIEFYHREVFISPVSSDYCSITRLSDTEVAIFICDVKGTGVRSALAISLMRGVIQELAGLSLSPGAYLERINKQIRPVLSRTRAFDASACQMILNVQTGVLRFASAGHPMPIYLPHGKPAKWLSQDPEVYGPALVRFREPKYVTTEFQLEAGDAILAFTDGLFSVPNNMDHSYGLKRLLDSSQSLIGDPLTEILEGLEGDALAFSRDGRFIDDVCLVGFHLKQLLD